jgi:hypothetical protein
LAKETFFYNQKGRINVTETGALGLVMMGEQMEHFVTNSC